MLLSSYRTGIRQRHELLSPTRATDFGLFPFDTHVSEYAQLLRTLEFT